MMQGGPEDFLERIEEVYSQDNVRTIWNGFRNGVFYGTRIRVVDAIVKTILYSEGPINYQTFHRIVTAVFEHGSSLGLNIAINKTVIVFLEGLQTITCTIIDRIFRYNIDRSSSGLKNDGNNILDRSSSGIRLNGTSKWFFSIAGFCGGYIVWGEDTRLNEMLNMYIFSRIVYAFVRRKKHLLSSTTNWLSRFTTNWLRSTTGEWKSLESTSNEDRLKALKQEIMEKNQLQQNQTVSKTMSVPVGGKGVLQQKNNHRVVNNGGSDSSTKIGGGMNGMIDGGGSGINNTNISINNNVMNNNVMNYNNVNNIAQAILENQRVNSSSVESLATPPSSSSSNNPSNTSRSSTSSSKSSSSSNKETLNQVLNIPFFIRRFSKSDDGDVPTIDPLETRGDASYEGDPSSCPLSLSLSGSYYPSKSNAAAVVKDTVISYSSNTPAVVKDTVISDSVNTADSNTVVNDLLTRTSNSIINENLGSLEKDSSDSSANPAFSLLNPGIFTTDLKDKIPFRFLKDRIQRIFRFRLRIRKLKKFFIRLFWHFFGRKGLQRRLIAGLLWGIVTYQYYTRYPLAPSLQSSMGYLHEDSMIIVPSNITTTVNSSTSSTEHGSKNQLVEGGSENTGWKEGLGRGGQYVPYIAAVIWACKILLPVSDALIKDKDEEPLLPVQRAKTLPAVMSFSENLI